MPDRWTIATWNVHGSARPDPVGLAERIAGLGAEIVALQEIRRAQATRIARHLGWTVVWRPKHAPWSVFVWWRTEGLAIASPHRVSDPHRAVVSGRTRHWSYRHRIMLSATVARRDGATLRIHDLHLSSDDPDERIAQARRAVPLIERHLPRVVAGDLNGDGEVELLREFRAIGLHDAGGDATNPSAAPRAHLDRILVPSEASVVDIRVPPTDDGWVAASDHLPLIVTVDY